MKKKTQTKNRIKALRVAALTVMLLVLSACSLQNNDSLAQCTTAGMSEAVSSSVTSELQSDTIASENIAVSSVSTAENTTESTSLAPESTTSETDNVQTCSLTVSCKMLLQNPDALDSSKLSLVPSDGVLLNVADAVIEPGDTVFSLLLREVQNRKMHIEYSGTSKTAYIEGIGNIYEFDGGSLSGWVYKVNGKAQSIGCREYTLQKGDIVEFFYTLNLGSDVGVSYE